MTQTATRRLPGTSQAVLTTQEGQPPLASNPSGN